MTIKDFKVGQTAYILEDRYRGAFGTATEVEVAKVGKRYVTVRDVGREARFYEPAYNLSTTICSAYAFTR